MKRNETKRGDDDTAMTRHALKLNGTKRHADFMPLTPDDFVILEGVWLTCGTTESNQLCVTHSSTNYNNNNGQTRNNNSRSNGKKSQSNSKSNSSNNNSNNNNFALRQPLRRAQN